MELAMTRPRWVGAQTHRGRLARVEVVWRSKDRGRVAMTTTDKVRTRLALLGQPVDRLPTQINYTRAMGDRLAGHLGVSVAELPSRLDNHLLRVDLSYPWRLSPDGRVAYDWWGAGWDTCQEGYFLADAPLSGGVSLDAYSWPDPHEPSLLDEARSVIQHDYGEHFVVPNLGFSLFERAWSLYGYTELLMDLLLQPRVVEDLLEQIVQIQVGLARRYADLGVDGGYFGDDYGAQNGMLFSPRIWRRLFRPRLARMFAVFRERDLPVILHSDGQIQEIIPDLVAIGVTVLNPAQPEVLDHGWLKRTFGEDLAYYGGVSTQTVLPYGTPGEVGRAVAQAASTLGRGGTGLVLAPSHRLMADVPLENVDALLAAFGALSQLE